VNRYGEGGTLSRDFALENLEQTARVVGERWARRLRAGAGAASKDLGPWPGTADEARHLLDDTFAGECPNERFDSLVSIVERCARAAWRGFRARRA
jgi:hypothetical protein